MTLRLAVPLLALALTAPAVALAGDPEPLALGEEAPRLRFVDIRYLPRSLDDLPGQKAYVIYFTTVECPLVRRYLPRVAKLERSYRGKGVQFLAVNEGPGDSVVDVATQAVEQGADFPFVKDFSGKVASGLGVDRSATVVVLDGERRLRYRGRVDDQYRFGGVRPKASRDDLREAIDDVLAGRPVRVAETEVDGCKLTPPSREPKAVTWAKDVAPVVHEHCASCHREGTEAPFALLTHADAAAQADMIGEVVLQGRMPPWFASPKHGSFDNHRGLSAEERETILAWVRAGAPAGDLSQAPEAPVFEQSEWRIDPPDLVLTAPTEAKLPAEGYVDYQYVLLPHAFTEDTWVSQVEIRPSNPRVLHHANLAYLQFVDGKRKTKFITGQVPGGGAMNLSPGQGFKIPKGATLVLQIHYVTTGQPETDRLSVGIRYPRWQVEKQLYHAKVSTQAFEIPPGASAHEVRASRTLPRDADAIGMFSHMHLRGRDMRFIAHTPDGKSETLLLIPNYNFDWQLAYLWKEGTRRFPKGTRIECVGHFDNSAFNPYNPDPTKPVRYGEQTYHEMFYGFFFYTDPNQHLGLHVDPETGWETAAPRPQKKQPKRYF